jgi:hypothetical protein
MNTTEALQQINYAASKAHSKHIAFGFGQMMVYQEKADEAMDFVAAKYPHSLSGYPLIEAEVVATRKSAKEVADGIINKRGEWLTTAAKIEKTRLMAKGLIKAKNANIDEIVKKLVQELDAI